jgi:predicted DNA-binding transcriptional regulator AlpA
MLAASRKDALNLRLSVPHFERAGASMTTPLFDTSALASYLGVSEQTLRQWRCAGTGPDYVKLGDSPKADVRYTRKDVEQYIADHRRANAVRAFVTEGNLERI